MNIEFTMGVDPYVNLSNIKKLGISSVYCGYVDDEIKQKYPLPFCTMNWRGETGSFENKESFLAFAEEAKKYNISINVTFNSLYIPEIYPLVLKALDFVSSQDAVKGIIVNDMGLLLRLKEIKYKKKIIMSVNAQMFNSSVVQFFKNFGATEFVFSKQVRIKELIDILEKHPDINIELFLVLGCCLFIEGYCYLAHTMEVKTGMELFNPKNHMSHCALILDNNNYEHIMLDKSISKETYQREYLIDSISRGCNLCAVKALSKYSNRIYYKLVSRGMGLFDTHIKYIDLMKQIEQENMTGKDVFFKMFGYKCSENCYFSEKFC